MFTDANNVKATGHEKRRNCNHYRSVSEANVRFDDPQHVPAKNGLRIERHTDCVGQNPGLCVEIPVQDANN